MYLLSINNCLGDSVTALAFANLRLIEPTSVSGRVMDGEAIPDFCGHFRTDDGNLSELETRTIRRGEGEMTARLWLCGAENIGSPATLLFVIPACLPSRRRRRGGPHVGMQGDGFSSKQITGCCGS